MKVKEYLINEIRKSSQQHGGGAKHDFLCRLDEFINESATISQEQANRLGLEIERPQARDILVIATYLNSCRE